MSLGVVRLSTAVNERHGTRHGIYCEAGEQRQLRWQLDVVLVLRNRVIVHRQNAMIQPFVGAHIRRGKIEIKVEIKIETWLSTKVRGTEVFADCILHGFLPFFVLYHLLPVIVLHHLLPILVVHRRFAMVNIDNKNGPVASTYGREGSLRVETLPPELILKMEVGATVSDHQGAFSWPAAHARIAPVKAGEALLDDLALAFTVRGS